MRLQETACEAGVKSDGMKRRENIDRMPHWKTM